MRQYCTRQERSHMNDGKYTLPAILTAVSRSGHRQTNKHTHTHTHTHRKSDNISETAQDRDAVATDRLIGTDIRSIE